MRKLLLVSLLLAAMGPASASVWMIGDNDGYGKGIADNADHTFVSPIWDGRSAAEMAATDGAQFTDTYSTTHPGYSPQAGTVATFTFSGLGNSWTVGSMWFDLADFQAGTFGAAVVTYNGIVQNWAFNDGYPRTAIHSFDLTADVLASINATGSLIINVDRNGSGDFYGFDYALLSDRAAADGTDVPEPASFLLLGAAMLGMAGARRRKQK
ncbi:MAG: PEP-CTERM sorting domain-containing protein [Pseudomonadota bacterium]